MPKILAFSGSGRKNSYNFSIAKCAAKGADIEGVELTIIDMSEFDMPIFNEDLEAESGMPLNAKKFKQLLMDMMALLLPAQSIIVATVRY